MNKEYRYQIVFSTYCDGWVVTRRLREDDSPIEYLHGMTRNWTSDYFDGDAFPHFCTWQGAIQKLSAAMDAQEESDALIAPAPAVPALETQK